MFYSFLSHLFTRFLHQSLLVFGFTYHNCMLFATFPVMVAFTYTYIQIHFISKLQICPMDNTWHTLGTMPSHVEPTKIEKDCKISMVHSFFGQNFEDSLGDWVHDCFLRRSHRGRWFQLVLWGLCHDMARLEPMTLCYMGWALDHHTLYYNLQDIIFIYILL